MVCFTDLVFLVFIIRTNCQVEESKAESLKTDKAATEKLLQETIEKNQAELAAQKEFYTNALTAAKEAEALAESRANDEARIELEGRLKEAMEREAMLIQTLEELRQTLSRKEQQVCISKQDSFFIFLVICIKYQCTFSFFVLSVTVHE